ncbi:probable glutathione S-transferase [Salvia splendens]|uniref:probable glutathione S-transferase n=1 Tax=Salvia splendens TaxID=180675 RepID=UPI001C26E360|nr:probable glutathione S-transferase [Salvia splendens]
MALKLKGVEYESIAEDLKNNTIQYNPIHKKVPVLIHNGKGIAESLIKFGRKVHQFFPRILIKEPWLVFGLTSLMKSYFTNYFFSFSLVYAYAYVYVWSTGEEQEKAKEESIEALKFLEDEIKGKNFFGGDNIGIVDIAANFIGYWLPTRSELTGVQIMTKENYP